MLLLLTKVISGVGERRRGKIVIGEEREQEMAIHTEKTTQSEMKVTESQEHEWEEG